MGRIGRCALKILLDTPEVELIAVNNIGPIENIAYLLKYDTVYNRFEKSVEIDGEQLIIDRQDIHHLHRGGQQHFPQGSRKRSIPEHSRGNGRSAHLYRHPWRSQSFRGGSKHDASR
jgi:glyceraldehyde 3-phosphate dehydrogenase